MVGAISEAQVPSSLRGSSEWGLEVTREKGSWNVFSHSHTWVNIPESQGREGLTAQQVQKALTLGSFTSCKGAVDLQKLGAKSSSLCVRNCIFQGETPWASSVSKRGLRHCPLKVKYVEHSYFCL